MEHPVMLEVKKGYTLVAYDAHMEDSSDIEIIGDSVEECIESLVASQFFKGLLEGRPTAYVHEVHYVEYEGDRVCLRHRGSVEVADLLERINSHPTTVALLQVVREEEAARRDKWERLAAENGRMLLEELRNGR